MKLLGNKVAFVSGASRGIGRGIVLGLAKQGASIAFTYRSSSAEAEAIEKELQSYGVKAKAFQLDAANYEQTEKIIQQVIADFGSLDIIVNNAGITKDNLLMRMTEEAWDEVMQTNLKSVFNVVKASQRQLLKQRSGSIINISSVVGDSGNAGQANYAASKAGMNGFTKSVAKELGSRGIRCNAIAPGFIETEMTQGLSKEQKEMWLANIPLKRGGTPEDIANLVVFIASDMSSYITGQVINVCGGMQT
ncbi:MAG: 3-oxoacyl-[acyl-carrier-protein] reductase [Flavobacteriales bacterium]|nr:3-oxoacyl-[acyl-carrier-protein] reductase [Flavobacteriales bacterium]